MANTVERPGAAKAGLVVGPVVYVRLSVCLSAQKNGCVLKIDATLIEIRTVMNDGNDSIMAHLIFTAD